MIRVMREGFYKLIETKHQTKILYLDNETYAWVESPRHGEMLVVSHKIHKSDCVLGMGHFIIYEVMDEPELHDTMHLELEVGRKSWQGYFIISGLPDRHKTRAKIIPTHEIISGNPRFKNKQQLHQSLAQQL